MLAVLAVFCSKFSASDPTDRPILGTTSGAKTEKQQNASPLLNLFYCSWAGVASVRTYAISTVMLISQKYDLINAADEA
jgi:hypothetical protein